MGKKFLVTLFLLLVSASLYVFWQRKGSSSAHERLKGRSAQRITLEDFTVYKYAGSKISSTLDGKMANFLDPSTLEVFGEVRGIRYNKKQKESFSAESMTVRFYSKGLAELSRDGRIESAELENQVRFGYGTITIFTDFAKYSYETQKLSSDRPVRMEGENIDFMGGSGFEFLAKTQDLRVFGPLEGTLSGQKNKN